jgi:uncharacterized protein YecE (DUF72 family)
MLSIGTSGWMYKDWGKTFYPPEMKKGFLTFLSAEFSTVEVNSSFYHLPLASTFVKWRLETPARFIFAVKLSRFITHQKRLEDCREPLERFLGNAKNLEEKLGPILIQLPPSLRFDKKVLQEFLADLTAACKKTKVNPRFALEPRHKSWMEEKNAKAVRLMLKKKKIAIVFPHSSRIPSFAPEDGNITADFVYIRFHGPSEFAASRYGAERLAPWAKRINAWRRKKLDVFVYFNNDVHGHAIHDARTLKKLCAK